MGLAANDAVTLDAQGDPNAVFIFQTGGSLTTGANTHVLFINGAQPCNVFWQIAASATLGANSGFVGTVMASGSITASAGATIEGRLLAHTGAVTLDTNTITTPACAAGTTGDTPPTGTTPTPPTGTTPTPPTGTTDTTPTTGTTPPTGTTDTTPPTGTTTTGPAKTDAAKAKAARRKAAAVKAKAQARARHLARLRARRLARERARREHHSPARRPIGTGGFTG